MRYYHKYSCGDAWQRGERKGLLQKGSACQTDLGDAVVMGHHPHYVVQRQERIALDFSVDVLALSACCQQLHKGDMIGQGAALIPAGSLGAHHVEEDGE